MELTAYDLTYTAGNLVQRTLLTTGAEGVQTVPADSWIVGGYYRETFASATTIPVVFRYALCVMDDDETAPTDLDAAWVEKKFQQKRLHRFGYLQVLGTDAVCVNFMRMRKFFLGETESLVLYIEPATTSNNVVSNAMGKWLYMKGR